MLSLLNADDRGSIEALPDHQRAEATTRCWVRSEAYLKGLGTGIARGLGEMTVGVDDSRPATVPGWSVRSLDAPEPFAAALACRGGTPHVVRRRSARRSARGPETHQGPGASRRGPDLPFGAPMG